MDRTIREYKLKDVYKRFGLNLVEFLNLPPAIAQKVLDISVEEALVEGKTYKDIQDELGLK
ncbi:MAG: hypothetical protein IBX57_00335 [Gammaproteobacteria bacterium]|nr:hypothetical protein [Gammaproteobacteria bacterium]